MNGMPLSESAAFVSSTVRSSTKANLFETRHWTMGLPGPVLSFTCGRWYKQKSGRAEERKSGFAEDRGRGEHAARGVGHINVETLGLRPPTFTPLMMFCKAEL